MDERDALTETVIGAAIEVHREMGPGLLESVYQKCLVYELRLRNLEAQLLTYLRLSKTHTGLLINFNVRLLKDGLKRLVL
jgi:hypothetical protein